MCWRWKAAPASPLCSRCSAARSRPIAGWPNMRWKNSCPCMGRAVGPGWTAGARCPAAICRSSISLSCTEFSGALSVPPVALARRLVRAYGTRRRTAANSLAALGRGFRRRLVRGGGGLSGPHEWARTAEDILWRRSNWRCIAGGHGGPARGLPGGRASFCEQRSKKTLPLRTAAEATPLPHATAGGIKSFSILFFKKEPLPSPSAIKMGTK